MLTQLNDKYGGVVWATVERIVLQFRLQVSLLGGISRSSSGNGRGEEKSAIPCFAANRGRISLPELRALMLLSRIVLRKLFAKTD